MKRVNDFSSVTTGDLVYVNGRGPISWVVKKLTRGDISHVAIVFTWQWLLEASATSGKVKFTQISKYKKANVFVRRLKSLTQSQSDQIIRLCNKYNRQPYSYLDVLLNALAFPMPKKMRRKFVSGLGNKKFTRCGELVRRVIWEATGYPPYKDFEASNPSEMFKDGEKTQDFSTVST